MNKKKKEATFQKLDKEDLKLINKAVNDKRQNLIQALKGYYQLLLTTKQAGLFQERLDNHIAEGGVIEDHYGLPMSKDEMILESQKNHIHLRFMRADLKDRQKDFKETWGLDEDKLMTYYTKWFIDNETLDL